MKHVDVSGLRIAYEVRGDGPPIVMLHGYVGDSGTWRPQIETLSDEFAVVAWDAPGFAGSSDPPETFRLRDYADCLAAFIEALGLTRPHILGLSFGGGLALELYRRNPAIPRSLVLASAYAGWAGSLPRVEVEHRLQQALSLADLSSDELVDALMPTMFTPSTPTEVVDRFAAMVSRARPSGFRTMAVAFAEADLRDVLPRVSVPTLLVYGDQDVRAPRAVANDICAGIPSSRLVRIPGAGHIVNLEAAERFNAEVRTFLRSAAHEH